ncbi:MAG: hypothetical protein FWG93_04845 [Oscillospiraceae bacterium]|nr:hypothetical protein [Oscillospiraceae bacterium]
MPDQNKPVQGQEPEPEREPIITTLSIPGELIDDPQRDVWKMKKTSSLQIALNVTRLLTVIAWVIAGLAVIFRLTDGLGTRNYAFLNLLPAAGSAPEGTRHVYVLLTAGALAVSSLCCGAGAALCAFGASGRASEGRLLLFLAVAGAVMTAVVYFLW